MISAAGTVTADRTSWYTYVCMIDTGTMISAAVTASAAVHWHRWHQLEVAKSGGYFIIITYLAVTSRSTTNIHLPVPVASSKRSHWQMHAGSKDQDSEPRIVGQPGTLACADPRRRDAEPSHGLQVRPY